MRGWRKLHPEAGKAASARWYAENREKANAASAAWQKRNRERVNVSQSVWQKRNPEKMKAAQSAWRKRNREKRAAYQAVWSKRYPEKQRVFSRNRKALQKGAEGHHTAADIAAQRTRQNGLCFWCKQKTGRHYHVDHVVPLSLGGHNGKENLIIACAHCNLTKHAKHPMDFAGVMF